MQRNILITGTSGYLGGSIAAELPHANLPPSGTIYALVRTDEQAKAAKQQGLEPLRFNVDDYAAVEEAIVSNSISIVFFLIDAIYSKWQVHFIRALGKVKEKLQQDVHFLHTSGAKIISGHSGAPTDKPLLDTDSHLFEIQKGQKAPYDLMQDAVNTNVRVIEEAEKYKVRSYIFVPCIVYGEPSGFGNKISKQTVAIIQAAKAARRVYRVDKGPVTWPVSHVSDTTELYLQMLRKLLANESIDYGRNGFYLAASGSVAWNDIYQAIATGMAKRGAVDDAIVADADEAALEKMAAGLDCPKSWVSLQLGGLCTLTAKHGEQIGWKSKYSPEHILEAADNEVELVLKHI